MDGIDYCSEHHRIAANTCARYELSYLIARQWICWIDTHDKTPAFEIVIPDMEHQTAMKKHAVGLYMVRKVILTNGITLAYTIRPENVRNVIERLNPGFPDDLIIEFIADIPYGETPERKSSRASDAMTPTPGKESAVKCEFKGKITTPELAFDEVSKATTTITEAKKAIAKAAEETKNAAERELSANNSIKKLTPLATAKLSGDVKRRLKRLRQKAKKAAEYVAECRKKEEECASALVSAEEELARIRATEDERAKERELAESKERDARVASDAAAEERRRAESASMAAVMKETEKFETPTKPLPKLVTDAAPDPTIFAKEHKGAEIARVERAIEDFSHELCPWIIERSEHFLDFLSKVGTIRTECVRNLACLCGASDIISAIDNASLSDDDKLSELIMKRIMAQYAASNHPELSNVSAIIPEFNADEFMMCVAKAKSMDSIEESIEYDEFAAGRAPPEPVAAHESRAREDMTELQLRSKCFRYGKCVLAKDANEYFKSITSQWPLRNQQEFEEDVKKARKDAAELFTRSETVDIYVDGALLPAFIAQYC